MAHSPLLCPSRNVASVSIIRRMSMETYMVRIYTGPLNQEVEFVSVEAEKVTPAEDIIRLAAIKLKLPNPSSYELAEVFSSAGQLCKERRLQESENPVRVQLLWPKIINADLDHGRGLHTGYRFYIRKKDLDNPKRTKSWMEYSETNPVDNFLTSFLKQPTNKQYSDLCNLPDLNERTLLENIKSRFENANIYTYVGSILIAVNPFKFFPIYNPKYVEMYQNKRLGDLPPHIFAVADAAFHTMLQSKKNQCIVISGESGSGKTENTNFLLHHLTALSNKGLHGSGVEQTIHGAGPVLEAFGNAKTVHNNNSSRFGKFIQVNYKENGMVHGAIVEKYLLEKSRIVSQAKMERNYHVFYYLLEGADELEREKLHLGKPEDYAYLNMSGCTGIDGVDEAYEFSHLKLSMEMVGFSQVTQKRIFGVLSAVLHLGNIKFKKKGDQHHDESVTILNPDTIAVISQVLKVQEKTLTEALTQKKATAGDETVVMTHRMEDALATRDAMAKCLYGALFDWIVLKVNQALLAKRHNSEHQGNSIGVLDIFGFEDFNKNSFEQFCINYANEHLQYYFNQHIFKFEQEEYKKEGIQWKNIEFIDNTDCLELFSKRPHGLFCLLDEECNFPAATNETLLTKFHQNNKGNIYYEAPQKREEAFTVLHYAGKVKYQVKDFREKNSDQIRTDIVGNLKSSSLSFVRELMALYQVYLGVDPVAVLRWTILKTLFKSVFAFMKAGKTFRERGGPSQAVVRRKQSQDIIPDLGANLRKNKSFKARSRPQTMFSDIKTLKAIASRTMYSGGKVSTKQKPPSVSAQFQWSLSRLMSTLNQANPFFIRCIKSNAEKEPCSFDEVLVLRQLRYTGMLATVRIRQSGYNYRLTFKEFTQLYKIILPKGLNSDKTDVKNFLESLNMHPDNFQIGKTKVFLREAEKLYLDESLHKAIMARVICIQRWVKTKVERKNYVLYRENTIIIQRHVRMYLARRRWHRVREAVFFIQRWYRGSRVRMEYTLVRNSAICIQAHFKGHLTRKRPVQKRRFNQLREEAHLKRLLDQEAMKQSEDLLSSASDEGVLIKDTSADELEMPEYNRRDSEESSGILDDSESDTLSEVKSRGDSIGSPPPTPTSLTGPDIVIGTLPTTKDDYLSQAKQTSRVQGLSKVFQSPNGSHGDDVDGRLYADSPTDKPTALSPERVKHIEDALKKPRTPNTLPISSTDDLHKSPLRNAFKKLVAQETLRETKSFPTASDTDSLRRKLSFSSSLIRRTKSSIKLLRDMKSTKKKNSCADDSDNDDDSTLGHGRKHAGGVQVLPVPTSPKSPYKEDPPSVFSDSEHPEDKRAIKKQRRTLKHNKDGKENRPVEQQKGWNVSKTSQWQYPADWIISETYELQLLDEFINLKILGLTSESGEKAKESQFDSVFQKCLRSFHSELKTTLSVVLQNRSEKCNLKYRDLFAQFEGIMDSICHSENLDSNFPMTICMNAFRGFLDEFRNSLNTKKKENKYKKKNRPKREKLKKDTIDHQGHKYNQVQFGIPTFCELCSNIIWIMEKGHVCQVCKYTCHKKCAYKSTVICKGAQDAHDQRISGTKVFSVPLPSLVEKGEKVPVFLENLIMLVENHGLFTEGIYRKSGSAPKVKLLKSALDNGTIDVNIDDFTIHVITSTLKSFFRELPEPLLTFELYDEFLQASEIQVEKEAIQVLYTLVERLPKVNHDVFERIVFHLARVANHEKSNKMSVNGLAIIFGPCLLRTNRAVQAQDMLMQCSKQTIVIEKILIEQLKKLQTTLQDIKTLESAENTANERLTVVRASMRNSKSPQSPRRVEAPPSLTEDQECLQDQECLEEQERVIHSHIKNLRKEKDDLTQALPTLEYRHSSDDEMLSIDDIESVYDTADEDASSAFDLPGCTRP